MLFLFHSTMCFLLCSIECTEPNGGLIFVILLASTVFIALFHHLNQIAVVDTKIFLYALVCFIFFRLVYFVLWNFVFCYLILCFCSYFIQMAVTFIGTSTDYLDFLRIFNFSMYAPVVLSF